MYSRSQQITAELCLAILLNDQEKIDKLSADPDFNGMQSTNAGYTPLYYAVKTGNAQFFMKLFCSLSVDEQKKTLEQLYDDLSLLDIAHQQKIILGTQKQEDMINLFSQLKVTISSNIEALKEFEKHVNTYVENQQGWLLTPLNNQRYTDSDRGYCKGFSDTAVQAFVLDDRDDRDDLIHVKSLEERVFHLKCFYGFHYQKNLLHDMEMAKHKRILWIELLKDKRNQEKNRQEWDVTDQDWLNKEINKELSKEERLYLELAPFFDTLEVYQHMEKSWHLELGGGSGQQSKNIQAGINFIPSIALEKQGGMISVDSFNDEYDAEGLEKLFSNIETFVEDNDYGGFELTLLDIADFKNFDTNSLIKNKNQDQPHLDLNRPYLIKDSHGCYKLWGYKEGQWQLTNLEESDLPEDWKKQWENNKSVYISLKDPIFKTLKQGHTRYGTPIVLRCSANEHAITLAYDPVNKRWQVIDANDSTLICNNKYDLNKNTIKSIQNKLLIHDIVTPTKIKIKIVSTVKNYEQLKKRIISPLEQETKIKEKKKNKCKIIKSVALSSGLLILSGLALFLTLSFPPLAPVLYIVAGGVATALGGLGALVGGVGAGFEIKKYIKHKKREKDQEKFLKESEKMNQAPPKINLRLRIGTKTEKKIRNQQKLWATNSWCYRYSDNNKVKQENTRDHRLLLNNSLSYKRV